MIFSTGKLVGTKAVWFIRSIASSSTFCIAGSTDLLLHLLSSVSNLPVDKVTIRDSGMGKKVGSIEKHRICAGTLNETAIRARVQQVKDNWNASVKARKVNVVSGHRNRTIVDNRKFRLTILYTVTKRQEANAWRQGTKRSKKSEDGRRFRS